MDKLKIAIWGITDDIWNDIKTGLDWRKVEISIFIDNNPFIGGKIYEGKRIHNFGDDALEEIARSDYVLIAAYSGYQAILKLLKDSGVNTEKIQLYISEGLIRYSFGVIENVNKSLVREIYNEPGKMIEAVDRYNRDARMMEDMAPMSGNEDKWYKRNAIVAHACGGYINGKKVMYSNSKEALEDTLRSGAKVIECDILGIEHNEVVVLHDYYRYLEAIEYNYTIQSLKDVLERIAEYKDVHLLIDVKWERTEEYNYYLCSILKCIGEFDEAVQKQLKEQIIMEVYEEESIKSARKEGFDVFFTQYRNPDRDNYKEVIKICMKYDIGVVGYGHEFIDSQLLSVFQQKNISVFAYSCNNVCDSITKFSEMRKLGLSGIFSDYIREG